MIKFETVGMYDDARNNPTLKSTSDVKNHSFLTVDGILYFIDNTIAGDNAYREGVVIPAGEFLRGYDVRAFEGQKLVADEKHIKYAAKKTYADIVAGTTLMSANADGQLEVITSAPTSGVYFKVTDKTVLTENAVKVLVMVADEKASA